MENSLMMNEQKSANKLSVEKQDRINALNKIADSVTAEFRRYNENNSTEYLINTSVGNLSDSKIIWLEVSADSFNIDQFVILQKYGFNFVTEYNHKIILSVDNSIRD